MIIAVAYKKEMVYGHFGKSQEFKLYEVLDKKVVKSEILDTSSNGHALLASFLKSNGVDVVICGGLGEGAVNALNSQDIKICAGVSGIADEVVGKYLINELKYVDRSNCNHHHEADQTNHKCSCGKH